MCGIVGYIGGDQAAPILLSGLQKLEYRGYDSAGVAVYNDGGLRVVKSKGRLSVLEGILEGGVTLPGTVGIGHTRWATHGAPSDINSHPQVSDGGKFAVVHNGIIENYLYLKNHLIRRGVEFVSETDTEVVAQMLEHYYQGDVLEAIRKVISKVEGSYALGIICADCPEKLFAVRKDSPLIIGVGEGENYIASDVPAILSRTRDIYRLKDQEIAVLTREGVAFYDQELEPITKEMERVQWDVAAAEKGGYEHFMMKEICEQPEALRKTISPRIRDGKIVDYPCETREIEGKRIREYRFAVKKNDCFVLMSDGVVYAGAGSILNLQGWTWEAVAEYTLKCTKKSLSASRLAVMLSQACDELYEERPGDDTTVAVARVIERRVVNIFTGPPKAKEDDEQLMHDFIHSEGKKVIAGGTSANIAARVLGREITTKVDSRNPDVPPMAVIDGIDLVTEGVLTLGKSLKLLKKYVNDEFDAEFFDELDADNGASRLAKLLIEECTELNLFVGTAINEAHKDSELNFELSMRQNLVEQLIRTMEKAGKHVKVKYY